MLELISILYPYLVALYLADCLFYVGKQQIAFCSMFGGSYRKLNPGLHLTGFLPGDRLFITGKRPFGLTPSGMYNPLEENDRNESLHRPEHYNFLPFASIDALSTDGSTLHLNENKSIQTDTRQEALLLVRRLSEIGALPYADRKIAIEAGIQKDTDLNVVRDTYDRWALKARPIDLMSTLLFACFFALLPLGLYLVPVAAGLMVVLIIFMLSMYGLILATAWRQHKHLYPEDAGSLYKLIATLIFSPVSTMHISVHLTRNLLAGFDFMAVSALLLPRKQLANEMRRELHLIETARNYSDKFGWEEYWHMRSAAMQTLLEKAALTIDAVFSKPQKIESAAVAYCPVCRTEYRDGFNSCSDCVVPLKAY